MVATKISLLKPYMRIRATSDGHAFPTGNRKNIGNGVAVADGDETRLWTSDFLRKR